jgi:hypothetical protein
MCVCRLELPSRSKEEMERDEREARLAAGERAALPVLRA